VNHHKRRNKVTNTAPPLDILSSTICCGYPCNVLVMIQLPYLTERHRKAECTNDIERRNRYPKPSKCREWLEGVVVKGDYGCKE
jgi:hypothetical protein